MPIVNGSFVPYTLARFRSDVTDRFTSVFGNSIDTSPESVFGRLIEVQANMEFQADQEMEKLFYSFFPYTATGNTLDHVALITERIAARVATGQVQLTIQPPSYNSNASIPFSATLADGLLVGETSEGIQFEVNGAQQFIQNRFIDVDVTAKAAGGATLANSVTHLMPAVVTSDGAKIASVTNPLAMVIPASGTKAKGVLRITITQADNGGVTLPANTEIASTATNGGGIIFLLDEALDFNPHNFERDLNVRAVEAGLSGNVPAGSVTDNRLSISGFNAINNNEAMTGGTEVENDDDFRSRIIKLNNEGKNSGIESIRTALLENQYVQSATIEVNNTSSAVDGLPNHSVEAIVDLGTNISYGNAADEVDNGVNFNRFPLISEEIRNSVADTLFNVVAAGIGTFTRSKHLTAPNTYTKVEGRRVHSGNPTGEEYRFTIVKHTPILLYFKFNTTNDYVATAFDAEIRMRVKNVIDGLVIGQGISAWELLGLLREVGSEVKIEGISNVGVPEVFVRERGTATDTITSDNVGTLFPSATRVTFLAGSNLKLFTLPDADKSVYIEKVLQT